MADWDADSPRLSSNLTALLRSLRDQAKARARIDVALPRAWHAEIMAGLSVPDPDVVGTYRGEPGLEFVGVRIGDDAGTPPESVASELHVFERRLRDTIDYLDGVIPPGAPPDAETLDAVLEVCAFAHAEWVRIHPFANGNGRTARLWANFIAMRYGLPPFVQLRPRPDGDTYAEAGMAAMRGEWRRTTVIFREMLEAFLGASS